MRKVYSQNYLVDCEMRLVRVSQKVNPYQGKLKSVSTGYYLGDEHTGSSHMQSYR